MSTTNLFTGKSDNYVKYRPTYPASFIDYLVKEIGISKTSIIADIGAGTGILARLLCNRVDFLYAIEPNDDMRSSCEKNLKGFGEFSCLNGTAEKTKLKDKCLDFITVAQAFHWFDRKKSREEFKRVLKPGGKVILVWNSRNVEDPLTIENDQLFRKLCPRYKGFSGGAEFNHGEYEDFFENGICDYRTFDNPIEFTLESFIGRALSASYAPNEGDDNYTDFIEGLTELFNKHNISGNLFVTNKTHSYSGLL